MKNINYHVGEYYIDCRKFNDKTIDRILRKLYLKGCTWDGNKQYKSIVDAIYRGDKVEYIEIVYGIIFYGTDLKDICNSKKLNFMFLKSKLK